MECATRSGGFVEEIRKYVALGKYSAATQHVPLPRRMVCPVRWFVTFPSLAAPALLKFIDVHLSGFTTLTSPVLRFSKTTLHKLHNATQLSHTRGRTHTKCRYSWRATMADPATSPQSHVPACAHITHRRRQRHSVIRRHRVVRTAWCTMGLRVPVKMFVLAVYFGGLYGAFQSYARTLYAEIIPLGEEARWYGLFSITDKVCTCICPSARAVY
jgi:hypothetical protein